MEGGLLDSTASILEESNIDSDAVDQDMGLWERHLSLLLTQGGGPDVPTHVPGRWNKDDYPQAYHKQRNVIMMVRCDGAVEVGQWPPDFFLY